MNNHFFNICRVSVCGFILAACAGQPQEETPVLESPGIRVAFYNVENLFDTRNDPATADDSFLPEGEMQWTRERYQQKLDKLAQVILALDVPQLLGLAEVENEQVLEDLRKHRDIAAYSYEIIHFDSPDPRGVDVALLYRSVFFSPFLAKAVKVRLDSASVPDILQVSGVLGERGNSEGNTVHLLVNHWPSRSGGMQETEAGRMLAANTLRNIVEEIFRNNQDANIIIMGDFNDEPDNRSILMEMQARGEMTNLDTGQLFNTVFKLDREGKGSCMNRGNWAMMDQIMISQGLLQNQKGQSDFIYRQESASVFAPDWLLEQEGTYAGHPRRTFGGGQYQGGYSDHLPVYIDLVSKGS